MILRDDNRSIEQTWNMKKWYSFYQQLKTAAGCCRNSGDGVRRKTATSCCRENADLRLSSEDGVLCALQVVANESEEGLLSDEVDVGSAFLMIWQFLFP